MSLGHEMLKYPSRRVRMSDFSFWVRGHCLLLLPGTEKERALKAETAEKEHKHGSG